MVTVAKLYTSTHRKIFPESTFIANLRHGPVVFQGEQWQAEESLFQTILLIAFFGIFLLSAIQVLGSDYNQNIALPAQLRESGIETRADITNVRSRFVSGSYTGRTRTADRTDYYAIYEFTVERNGQPRKYRGEYQVTDSAFVQITQALYHGEKMRFVPVHIVYLSTNPEISLPRELVERDPATATTSMLCITLPLIAFFVIGIIVAVWMKWREISLSNGGYLIEGKIVSSEWTTVGKRMALAIQYTFTTPEGLTVNQKHTTLRSDITELPASNTPVAVLYGGGQNFKLM
jgi:hypothetical protein